MSIKNKFIRNKDEETQESTMETIFGKKSLRLFPAVVLLIILGGAITTSNSPLKGLLCTVISGITIVFSTFAIYKIIRYKVGNSHDKK